MGLPIKPVFPPMEALLVNEIPMGDDWQYEPKWDGFRCHRLSRWEDGGAAIEIGPGVGTLLSRDRRAVAKVKALRFVIDGELIITLDGEPSFDALLQRIHPAASRVAKLSKETPARFVVFDLLVDEAGKETFAEVLKKRRQRLEAFAKKFFAKKPSDRTFTENPGRLNSAQWLNDKSVRLDGVIAKRLDLPYRSGERDGMKKVKKLRTADCVVGGFRYLSAAKVVGSLLLGLYDNEGLLHHVGLHLQL